MDAEMTIKGANLFIRKIVQEKGANIYRMKGFLAIQDSPMKYVFHSVGMIFDIKPLEKWKDDEKRECVFVIIGKNLEQEYLETVFKFSSIQKFQEVKNETLQKYLGQLTDNKFSSPGVPAASGPPSGPPQK